MDIAGLIAGALNPLFGEGGVLDQAIYTKDEKAENAYLQTLANAQLANSQANQSLATKKAISPELVQLVTYLIGGLIAILVLIFLLRWLSK